MGIGIRITKELFGKGEELQTIYSEEQLRQKERANKFSPYVNRNIGYRLFREEGLLKRLTIKRI